MLWETGANKGSVYWFCEFIVVEMSAEPSANFVLNNGLSSSANPGVIQIVSSSSLLENMYRCSSFMRGRFSLRYSCLVFFFNQSSFVVEIRITFKRYSHYRKVVIYGLQYPCFAWGSWMKEEPKRNIPLKRNAKEITLNSLNDIRSERMEFFRELFASWCFVLILRLVYLASHICSPQYSLFFSSIIVEV